MAPEGKRPHAFKMNKFHLTNLISLVDTFSFNERWQCNARGSLPSGDGDQEQFPPKVDCYC